MMNLMLSGEVASATRSSGAKKPGRMLVAKRVQGLRGRVPMKRFSTALPVHIRDELDRIVELEDEAWSLMGGTTSRYTLGDLLEVLLEWSIAEWYEKHGKFPEPAQRKEYVRKLAESHLAELRAELLGE